MKNFAQWGSVGRLWGVVGAAAIASAAPAQTAPPLPAPAPVEAPTPRQAESAEVAKARAAIGETLARMSRAAVAGDAEGYLACVDRTDSEFSYEQAYFAKDLARATPSEAVFTLGESLSLADGTASGKVTITWTMPQKKERTVSFDCIFTERDGQWLYAGESWETHATPQVVVLADPGLDELAAAATENFLAVRDHVVAHFGLQDSGLPRRTQKIKIYASMKHLQASICLAYEDPLSGWNEPGESIKLLAGPSTAASRLKHLLAHEYGHVATFELGPKANNMPWWVLEGVAETASLAFGRSTERKVLDWMRKDALAPWEEITDFHNTPKKYMGHVYAQGEHMMTYIGERFSLPVRNDWMRAMSTGKTIDEASMAVLKLSFAELDAAWRQSMREKIAALDAAKAEMKDEAKPAAEDGGK